MPGVFDPYYRSEMRRGPTIEDLRRVVQWLSSPPEVTDQMRSEFLAERQSIKNRNRQEEYHGPVLLTRQLAKPLKLDAEGAVNYYNGFLGEPTKEDMVVQAVRLKTNLTAVHHANLLAFKAGEFTESEYNDADGKRPKTREGLYRRAFGQRSVSKATGTLNGKKVPFLRVAEPVIVTFSRRAGLIEFAKDSAVFLPKGTQLTVQLHMQPTGKPETVDAQFELLGRSYKSPFGRLHRMSLIPLEDFKLAPGQASYVARASTVFEKRAHLKLLWIHSHYRGVAARIQTEDSKGQRKTIASLPFMQFKMDSALPLAGDGLVMQPGSKLITEIEYDNSDANSANPDPSATVRLGEDTYKDEMHFPRFLYVED
jgi:hypothetical protein